jgi:hypothetical protein
MRRPTQVARRWVHPETAPVWGHRLTAIDRRQSLVIATFPPAAVARTRIGPGGAQALRQEAPRGSATAADRRVAVKRVHPAMDRPRDDLTQSAIANLDHLAIVRPGDHPSANANGMVIAHVKRDPATNRSESSRVLVSQASPDARSCTA